MTDVTGDGARDLTSGLPRLSPMARENVRVYVPLVMAIVGLSIYTGTQNDLFPDLEQFQVDPVGERATRDPRHRSDISAHWRKP